MANIQSNLNKIKNAVLGIEVRDSIHDAIKQCYDDASAKDNANMEVKMARGEYENLGKRLDSHSSQIKEIESDGVTKETVEAKVQSVIEERIEDGTLPNLVIGDNSISNEKIQDISIEKVKKGEKSLTNILSEYDKLIFKYSKDVSGFFTSSFDGAIELIYDENTSDNTIKQSNIVVNDNTINLITLLPGEIISDGKKDVWFEKRSIKEFEFTNLIEKGDEWARVSCMYTLSDLYNKGLTSYNVITDNDCKFVPKPQTEFSSYLGNMIGLHSNGTLQIKVNKTEVENSGRVYDGAGILDYANNLPNFNVYLKLTSKKIENIDVTTHVNKGDVIQLSYAKFKLLYNKEKPIPTLITQYKALATNNNNFDVINRLIKINCDFDYGVVKNKKYIKIKSSSGNYIDCQIIDNKPVRYNKPEFSTHKDGSIKNCTIILLDNFASLETKEYTIEVYSDELESQENFIVNETETGYEIECNNIKLVFNKNKNSFLTHIYKNEVLINSQTQNIPFRLTQKVLDTTYNLHEVGTMKEFTITNGAIMCEIEIKVEYNNILHDITYEFYKNGEIRCINYNTALVNGSNCYSILLRSNTEYSTIPTYSSKNPTSYYEPNGVSTRVVYSNADIPRDEGYGYPVFKSKAFGMQIGDTNCYSCICGWEFSDTDSIYKVPQGFVFSNCIVINTTSNGKDNAYELNPIIGEVIKDNIVNNKHNIKDNIVRLVKAINPQIEKVSDDSKPTYFTPSTYARLILAKETDLYSIDEVSNMFKTLMVWNYRANASTKLVNSTDLKAKYDEDKSPLQMSSRVFPICKFLLKEYKKIGNTDEINYYETTIKEYAEFICQVFEEKGNTPLYSSRGLNANSTASGCKALSDGLEIEENTRWRNALNGNVEVLKNYKVENILREGNNVSCEQYLHYHTFAAHDYFACNSLDSYIINPSQYVSMCLNSKGEVMDEIWCCSRSRRGLTSTIGYIIFLLVKDNTPQSIQLANKMLNSLWENFDYNGTQNYPLYGFDFLPPQTDETSTPMQLQSLCETYYMLEEMGI